MKLRNEFEVPVGVEQVWDVLLDVERVAPCLPGATIEGQDGDTYRGSMKLKLGPITSTYKGTVKIEEADEASRRAVMRAQAKDARGQGTAAATITSTMEAVGDATKVAVETDMRVTGPAAQFGRGVMQDVSAKLMRQFADCLEKKITGEPEEPAAAEAAAAEPAAPGNGDGAAARAATPPSGAAAAGAATSPSPGAGAPGPNGAAERGAPDVLDLGEVSRDAVVKRVVPVVGGLLLALVVLRLVRKR
jgi:carbon monoxide dehydrogenase subunit G